MSLFAQTPVRDRGLRTSARGASPDAQNLTEHAHRNHRQQSNDGEAEQGAHNEAEHSMRLAAQVLQFSTRATPLRRQRREVISILIASI